MQSMEGGRVLDSKSLLGRQPSDSSECLVEYLEIVKMQFDADLTNYSAV
jgi:hypothetical protein